jgi:uncharacterized protein (TIGR02246 family)
MPATDSERIALAFVDCIDDQDVEGLAALMTEDHTFIGDREGDVDVGRETMREGFRSYFADFPDFRIHMPKVTRSGGDVAIIGTTTGSHVPPELEEMGTVVWIATIGGGLVAG